ncbi:PadR family transcriptional regulator [Lysinibacillus odysseyi]|uniref:Replication-relaxation family protein n=1 Tax=Lysinibacillus odysseyi 34hs-1 = NBRC 100172 TaxID=1220589 RepID=A0A0A3J0Y7_9BACI|nr:PadR family transcriptional regulator [Lysinibacillus odysseyi]KGR88803.1 hypothetical protein CD32_01090 [Lysinibacillus odysseyi 34hs-1 = NBRC 100172]
MITNIVRNSVKQSQLIEFLAKTRGGNAEQIAKALYQKCTSGELTKTYELLKKLERKGYIEYFVYSDDISQRRFYYLTKKGLELFQDFYNIKEPYKGTGFFRDYGYFKHSLYKPKPNQIKHLLMCVDAMVDVYLLMIQYPDLNIDFANNLYAATRNMKADFIIMKSKETYYAEIDRSNERGIALSEKFKRYNGHFKKLENEKLPLGIYFIVPNPKKIKQDYFDASLQKRFMSVADAYRKECADYLLNVDLCFLTVSDFSEILQEDLLPDKINEELVKYLREKFGPSFNLSWNNKDIYYVKKGGQTHYIFTEIRWQRINIWYKLLKQQEGHSEKVTTEGGLLKFEDFNHIPEIHILTGKRNLIQLIDFNKQFNSYNSDQLCKFIFKT